MGAEKRIVFAIPRHEMVIVGTTDTDYPGDPSEVRAEKSDVEYLLKVIEQYFPGVKIGKGDIIATYSGVRPLIDDKSETESKTSREHEIWNDPRGCTFVAGVSTPPTEIWRSKRLRRPLGTFRSRIARALIDPLPMTHSTLK